MLFLTQLLTTALVLSLVFVVKAELLEWVDASDGQIPFIDWNDKQQEMYLARAEHDGGIYPGTYLPEEGVVDIPVGGEVISKSEYQVCQDVIRDVM